MRRPKVFARLGSAYGRRRVLVVAMLAATSFTLLGPLTNAVADPTDPPAPDPAATAPADPGAGGTGDTGEDGYNLDDISPADKEALEDFEKSQKEKLSDSEQAKLLGVDAEKMRTSKQEGGVLSIFNVTDANGVPISVYDVGNGEKEFLDLDWQNGVINLLTELCFMAIKWLVAFCCWLIAWALGFGLAQILLKPVLAVANALHTQVIYTLGLPGLLLAACALICAWHIFFGDRARGWGDAALSVVISAVAATTVFSPTSVLMSGENGGAVGTVKQLSLAVADVIVDAGAPEDNPRETNPNPTADNTTTGVLVRPITDALTDAFIVRPSQLIKYGRTFDDDCTKLYADAMLQQATWERAENERRDKAKSFVSKGINGVLNTIQPANALINGSFTEGPAGDVGAWAYGLGWDWAKNHYGEPPLEKFEAKCVPNAGDAKRASWDKLIGCAFILIAALIIVALGCYIAATFLMAQARIAYDAVRGEAALVAGIAPGAGRAYLWGWLASVARSLVEMFTAAMLLGLFIVAVRALMEVPAKEFGTGGLTLRFLILDIICLAAMKKRKALALKSKEIGRNIRTRLSSNRIGGIGNSVLATPPAPAGPLPSPRRVVNTLAQVAMVGGALATGNAAGAAAGALRRDGAAALATRLNRRRGGRRPAPRPRPNRPRNQRP
ncbi:hypothetical protein G5C51_04595 [Streptomyces sp. A7024]|uniref:Integral membrane protein n=1 Tax=Streptomyces coryli TaxID=1128680 RepID=A0A6G4TVW6_9ACTN|nr:hypothetical protein [Streptomyces coryli]NGN63187.1 hypothetical protein [Streptomyces coryli]